MRTPELPISQRAGGIIFCLVHTSSPDKIGFSERVLARPPHFRGPRQSRVMIGRHGEELALTLINEERSQVHRVHRLPPDLARILMTKDAELSKLNHPSRTLQAEFSSRLGLRTE